MAKEKHLKEVSANSCRRQFDEKYSDFSCRRQFDERCLIIDIQSSIYSKDKFKEQFNFKKPSLLMQEKNTFKRC